MTLSTCPNCGGPMVRYRSEVQPVRDREVRLVWRTCSQCHHFSLAEWTYVERSEPEPVTPVRTRPEL
jgi:RNase P subunit RPR2